MGPGESISACLIARNEEDFLPGCLRSLTRKVDEIVIVDTGSTDRTVDIAIKAGAKVLHHSWDDNFSVPRNMGLEAASGDWILYIDADERLTTPAKRSIGASIAGADASAARLLLQPRIGYTCYSELRLFRNDPRIRFEGIIHERITESLRRVCRHDGTIVASAHHLRLEHIGYEGDQSHKHARNEPILRKALKQDPDRVYCWFHLAVTSRALGEFAEMERCLEQAVQRAVRSGSEEELSVASSCCQIRSEIAMDAGDARQARSHAEKGLEFCPENLPLIWIKGRALLDLERPRETIDTVLPLTEIDPDRIVHQTLSFDKGLFRRDAHALLGSAHFELGEYRRAAQFFDRAEQEGGDAVECRAKAALSRSLARQ